VLHVRENGQTQHTHMSTVEEIKPAVLVSTPPLEDMIVCLLFASKELWHGVVVYFQNVGQPLCSKSFYKTVIE